MRSESIQRQKDESTEKEAVCIYELVAGGT